MSAGAPWSVKGIDPKAREVAKDLARRSGMTLGEWLNRVILEDDLPDEVADEIQFGERPMRVGQEMPRLRAVANSDRPPATAPDLARIALALDRLTDRIEASETRTGLAITGVEHSVRQALARIDTAEREQQAAAARLEGLLAEASAEQSYNGERIRRLEADPAGPRSAEALRMLEQQVARAEPETVVEVVLDRLGDRLAMAEARTAAALEDLKGSLSAMDRRLGSVERGAGEGTEHRFEALAQVLTRQVEDVRAEVAEKLASATGGAVEARFAELTEQVRVAERRSAEAVEAIGRQVLAMAEAVGRKLTDVDQRSADAIDQVGTEVARIAGAVELRLARAEQTQAEGFDRLGAELARATERLAERFAPQVVAPPIVVQQVPVEDAVPVEDVTADEWLLGPPPEPQPEPAAEPQSIAELVQALGPPPEPEPETATAAFGPELFSRAEAVADDIEDDVDIVTPAWRRLDLDVPETEIPDTFAPIAEDEDLFEAAPTSGPELSTREVIDRARAAARAAQGAARTAEAIGPEAARQRAADVRARLGTRSASGRLFQGFNMKPRRAPNSALQTALMVAGGAAFLSVGAAGLTLMQAPDAPVEQQTAALPPLPPTPRAAMALGPASFATDTTDPQASPVFAQVRMDVEAGVPGAIGQLKALADAGHAQGQLYLAQLYDGGEAGLPRNPVEARRLTTLAAEAGDVKAMHNLGVYLFRGEGGAQDLTGAAQWFRKAAAAGVVESQYNLGLLYQSGSGVAQDPSQARYWFRLAAARGDAEARRALADLKVPSQTAQR